jgi:signal peptidase I
LPFLAAAGALEEGVDSPIEGLLVAAGEAVDGLQPGHFLMPFVVLLLDLSQSASLITAILVTALGSGPIVYLGAVIDTARVRLGEARLPTWKQAALVAVAFVGVVWVLAAILDPRETIRERYVQAYVLSAESMRPALLTGDHFLADKFPYRSQAPARGDVIVFAYPPDESRDFVKRVVGLPGETLWLKGRRLYVDCSPELPACQPIEDPWGRYDDRPGTGESVGRWEIPAGSYFVMGDDRNNSQDSRYWGFVETRKIRGKVTLVYWSWDRQGVEKPPWARVRWSRIGRRVR